MYRIVAPIFYTLSIALFLCFGSTRIWAQSIELITVAEPSDVDKLNPLTNFSSTGSYIGEYLYFSLLGSNKETGEFVPLIAEDLPQVSADLKTYSFNIHPQARFNSGQKIMARDVIFSLKLFKVPNIGSDNNRVHYFDIVKAVATSERSVDIIFKNPSPQGMRTSGDFPIFSESVLDPDHVLEDFSFTRLNQALDKRLPFAELNELANRVNAFGNSFNSYNPEAVSGPYLLESWKMKSEIVLVANKKFWGKKLSYPPNAFFKQNVATIKFKIISDESEIRSVIFHKTADLLTTIPPNMFYELSEIPSLRKQYEFLTMRGPAYEYIGMNIKGLQKGRKPLFEQAEVRRAIAHLVPVDALLEDIQFGLADRIASEFPYAHPDYRNEGLALLDHNLGKAKELLALAGWQDNDDNGLVDRDEVQFVAEIIYNENAPHRRLIAEGLQKSAMQVGILITVVELTQKEYLKRLTTGDYDLAVGAWVSDPGEDSYRQIWHSSNWGSGSNFGGFGNSETDQLIEAYDGSMDPSQRMALAKLIQEKIYVAQPYVFLWARPHNLIVAKSMQKANIYQARPGFWIGEWEQ